MASLETLRKLAANPHYQMSEAQVHDLQRLQEIEFEKNKTNVVKHNPEFQKHNPELEKEGNEQDSRNTTSNRE